MTYIEYLKWKIELLKLDNVILFPIEKTIKENDKKDKIDQCRPKFEVKTFFKSRL